MNAVPKERWLTKLDPANPKHVLDAYRLSVHDLERRGFIGRGQPVAFEVSFGEGLHIGVCLGCRCTELTACDGGCAWLLPNLCTRCAGRIGIADPNVEVPR